MKVGGLIATTAYNSLYTVEPGYSAVVFNRFTESTFSLTPGIYFLPPFVYIPSLIEVKETISLLFFTLLTRDLKWIEVELHLLAQPQFEMLINLHKKIGVDYCNKLLSALSRSMLEFGKEFTISNSCR
ncbi:hypothetical protein VIGAN_UM136800 [Vigna angularis var. angularis]|uniref:Prohibitin n=1 Tax=Vigna angularis var. angularis TaxID=157739 RepID=A0A0S3TEP8_PHAAN|nr:hypothetical protein VIGAN_03141400 [Vigna angularis var. angularis]BAU03591.1 hypothetical protein VIGAN_UM136800 [Vigna angularis var. angularis]